MDTPTNAYRQVESQPGRPSWSTQMTVASEESLPLRLQKSMASLRQSEPGLRFLLGGFLEEGQISLTGHNWSIWENTLDNLLGAKNLSEAKRSFERLLQEVIGHPTWGDVQSTQNLKLGKVLRKVLEKQFGFMNAAKLINIQSMYRMAAKTQSGDDPTSEQRRIRAENLSKIYPWDEKSLIDEHPAETWHDVAELASAFSQRFGIRDIQMPIAWTLPQVRQWLWWAAEDLEIISDFLKIQPSGFCPFNLALAPTSVYGPCSFGVAENTMFLDDQLSFAFMHEWFHFFDWRLGQYLMHILQEYDVAESAGYWSSLPYEELHDFLPEGQVLAAGEFMRNFIMNGELYQKSSALDKRSSEKAKYWTQQHEMFARSFEMWLYSSLKGKLKVLLPNTLDPQAYPVGAQQAMNNAFWVRTWPGLAKAYERGLQF